MNEFQKLVCQQYGGGDYAYIMDKPELWEIQARQAGDTLFLFLMIELSDAEGCETKEYALMRLNTAMIDIDTVLSAVEAMEVANV